MVTRADVIVAAQTIYPLKPKKNIWYGKKTKKENYIPLKKAMLANSFSWELQANFRRRVNIYTYI